MVRGSIDKAVQLISTLRSEEFSAVSEISLSNSSQTCASPSNPLMRLRESAIHDRSNMRRRSIQTPIKQRQARSTIPAVEIAVFRPIHKCHKQAHTEIVRRTSQPAVARPRLYSHFVSAVWQQAGQLTYTGLSRSTGIALMGRQFGLVGCWP